jgi:hypothetical protein
LKEPIDCRCDEENDYCCNQGKILGYESKSNTRR